MSIAVQRLRSFQAKGWFCLTCLLLITMLFQASVSASAEQEDMATSVKLLREGARLLKDEVEQLESLLKDRPDDIQARTRLLGFYFYGGLPVYGHAATIEARRRHILWFIEHDTASALLTLGETSIDPKGHALADPTGYEIAAAAWMEQTRKHPQDVGVLRRAAKFFQLPDKERAASLLISAQAIQPDNRELSALRGYVNALGILGVTMINQNGLPTAHDPAEAKSDFAIRAVNALRESPDPAMVGVAGQIIGQYGAVLSALDRGSDRFTVDYAPLAEILLAKAQELEPGNPQWPQQLELLRGLRPPVGAAK